MDAYFDSALRAQADFIVRSAIQAVLPDQAVTAALAGKDFPGDIILVAAGKAAWRMARAASDCLGSRISRGIVITKYGHAEGPVGSLSVREAGHPVPDENGFAATREAVALVQDLRPEDTVLFLLSGGSSALFEVPLIGGKQLQGLTRALLACGADVTEINTIRKRLSGVKGGRFARLCSPAHVLTIALSDVLGSRPDMIGSGPTCPDSSTCRDALAILEKYSLQPDPDILSLLEQETPKTLPNAEITVTGSVSLLCQAAAQACRSLGYKPFLLTDQLCCEASQAGSFLGSMLQTHRNEKAAFLAGGETVVRLTGSGMGGRNQEIALSAAGQISGIPGAALFSFGSDGTDGPTDAAGGYVDWKSASALQKLGIDIPSVLRENDSYHALEAVGGLIVTGPTGTNVNDVAVALMDPEMK